MGVQRLKIEDEVIKIIFVKSKDNDSDIMTINLTGDLHDKHPEKILTQKPYKENFIHFLLNNSTKR